MYSVYVDYVSRVSGYPVNVEATCGIIHSRSEGDAEVRSLAYLTNDTQ